MNKLRNLLGASLMALAILAGLSAGFGLSPAMAATGFSTVFPDMQPPNIAPKCYDEATDAQTFNSTAYALVTNGSCVFVPQRNDPTGAALQGAGLSSSTTQYADQVWASFSIDFTKATSTNGQCGLIVNGALLPRTVRTTTSASGEESASWEGFVPNSTVGSQTISLECKSGDTAVLTVNFASLLVLDVSRYPLLN